MIRFWITMHHAASLVAHAALLASEGAPLCTASDAVTLTVGELAARIWRLAGPGGAAEIELLGIRRGETLTEVLVGPGERLGEARHQGICEIEGDISTAGAAWVVERLPAHGSREDARAIWLEAMQRPGLLAPGRVESRTD
jgi:FlaA1/EpsC-like NDP-sugar epimerase